MKLQLLSQACALSLACPMQLCDHKHITKPPWAMWELDLKLDLQGHPNVTLCGDGSGYTQGVQKVGSRNPRESPPTRSRAVTLTLSAKMASVLSSPVADLSLAALETRSA